MSPRNYGAIRDGDAATQFIQRIVDSNQPFAFDIEAGYTGEDKVGVSLQQFHPDYVVVGISFTVSTEWARYIPFAHDGGGNVTDLPGVARALWQMLNTGRGVAHNAAYELKGMSRFFREQLWDDPFFAKQVRAAKGMFPILADTMLLVWLAAEYDPMRVGKDLKSVALEAFNLKMTKFDDLFPSEDSDLGPATKRGGKKFIRFNTRNAYSPKIIEYACEDSVASLLIFLKHWDPLKDHLVTRFENQLLPVLVEMEMGPCDEHGRAMGNMLFDWGVIRKKGAEAQKFAQLMNEEIQSELSRRLGRTVNINLNSVPQLAKVLFDDAPDGLGLPVKMRSEKTNNPSTSDDALKVIAKSDPIIKKLLEYRQVVKLNGSYLQKFINELGYSGTGYVFPNHNQAGALTGRMSVDQVSYQQWPKPYHFELSSGLTFDLNFRDLFIAPEGFRIVGFDYANVEMRIAGAMSGERKIVDAFNSGMDLHKSTAAATFKVAFDEVTKKQRSAAKTLNFAILYGSGAGNIAEMLTSPSDPVTKEDAEQMLADYLAGYPALADWIASQQAIGREQKFVCTHFGRKFTIWEHYQPKEWIRAKGDRMAVNAPIQGTAADVIKIAMIRTQKAIKKAGLEDKIRMTLTIHDALEFLVHESVSTKEVIDLIEPCVNFPIAGFPLEIRSDWHEGYQWGAVAEVKLSEDKQVTGYELEYELPWKKEAFKWEAPTLRETLRQYYDWEWQEFGLQAPFYAKRDPEYTVPERQVLEAAEAVVEAIAAKAEPVSENEPVDQLAEDTRAYAMAATITLTEMPTFEAWERFETFLRTRPGDDMVRVELPEGILIMDTRHKLSVEDQPTVSLILGGAGLVIGPQEADVDSVMDGLVL